MSRLYVDHLEPYALMKIALKCVQLPAAVLLLCAGGCHSGSSHPDGAPGTTADVAAVRLQADAWSKAIAEKDLEKTLAFYAPDAHYLSAGRPAAETPAAIRRLWVEDFKIPGFASDEVTTKIEVASSRDLAFQIGTYTLTQTGADGAPARSTGKFAVMWKKQPDGAWKSIVDVDNADQ